MILIFNTWLTIVFLCANFAGQTTGPSTIPIYPLEPGIDVVETIAGFSFNEIRRDLYEGKAICFKKGGSHGNRVWVDLTDLAVQGFTYYSERCFLDFKITFNRAAYGHPFTAQDLGRTVDGISLPKYCTVSDLESVARDAFSPLDSISTGFVTPNGEWLDSALLLDSPAVTAHAEQGLIHLHLRKIPAEARG